MVIAQTTGSVHGNEVTGTNESITDWQKGLGSYNECSQTKDQWAYPLSAVPTKTYNLQKSGNTYRVEFLPSNVAASLQNLNTSATAGSYPPQDSSTVLKARATNQMQPGVPPIAANMSQFLGELTDFRGFFEGLYERLLKLPSTIANMLLTAKPSKRRRLSGGPWNGISGADIIGAGVQADLVWKLVISPMIKDCKQIKRAWLDLERVYRRVLSTKPYRVRGRAESSSDAPPMDYGSSSMASYVRSWRQRKIEVCTWAMVRNDVPFDLSKGAFMRHYFGLMDNWTSTGWELVPLSFIVDWFVDVGRFLRQFERSSTVLPHTIVSSGWSVKTTITHADELIWNLHTDLTGGATHPGVAGAYQKVTYLRQPGSLDFDNSDIEPLQIGLPNLSQIGTLGEILALKFKSVMRL
jgi:hypothetical protein